MFAFFLSAGLAEDIESLRDRYQEGQARIDDELDRKIEVAGDIYVAGLKGLEAQLQQAGNLKALLNLSAEREHFEKNQSLRKEEGPGTAKLRAQWKRHLQGAELYHARQTLTLAERYLRSLKQQVINKTREGLLEEAKAIQHEVDTLAKQEHIVTAQEVIKRPGDGSVERGNVALARRGTTATGFRQTSKAIDGDLLSYRKEKNPDLYLAYSRQNPSRLIITFPRVYRLQRIRFLLFDLDKRYYRYKVETSADGETWDLLVDRTTGEWRSWQNLAFDPRPVKQVKVTGTKSSVFGGFHVVEFEAYCTP